MPKDLLPKVSYADLTRAAIVGQLRAACAVRDAYRKAGDEMRATRHLSRINRLLDCYNATDGDFAQILRRDRP